MNPPLEPIRWSFRRVMHEFKISQAKLGRRITELRLEPGEDGCFSSYDVRMIFEDPLHGARLAKLKAETEIARARTAVLDRDYLPKKELETALARSYAHIRSVIERAGLPEASKVAIYRELGKSPEHLASSTLESEKAGAKTPRKQRRVRSNGHLDREHVRSNAA